MGWGRVSWKGGVVSLALLLWAVTSPASETVLTVQLDRQMEARLDGDREILLLVTSHRGDAWSRLARRITGDSERWKDLSILNGMSESLKAGSVIRVPLSMLKPALKADVVRALFPKDRLSEEGWIHTVVASGLEGESYWKIAEWFTGDGANYGHIRKASRTERLSTRQGELVLVPRRLLSAAFVEASSKPPSSASTESPVREESEPATGGSAAESASVASRVPPALEYVRTATQPYAVYHLQKGEALYSSVAIRFTGRIHGADVNAAVAKIVDFNSIGNVSRLPVGYGVKIPMEMLTAEFRPIGDPRRIEYEAAKRASARMARRVQARNLSGVHIILDAGHGGRDVGATHGDVWESIYVYDVVARLRQVLSKTNARVSMTTRPVGSEYRIADSDKLKPSTDHMVLTTPPYDLSDPVVGVHLRWYLANSIFRRALRAGLAKEKVIFISVHADSLHASLRGAMAYVPGERYVRGTYSKSNKVYLARSEVRERPSVTQSAEEALEAEGFSTLLAESLLAAFSENELAVHPFSPIRDNVVRDGEEWVPAVIRYNKVPTRVLLEICNLGNESDRKLVKTRKYRQAVAEAVFDGVVEFFEQQGGPDSTGKTAAK